jgi:hypothetical protein
VPPEEHTGRTPSLHTTPHHSTPHSHFRFHPRPAHSAAPLTLHSPLSPAFAASTFVLPLPPPCSSWPPLPTHTQRRLDQGRRRPLFPVTSALARCAPPHACPKDLGMYVCMYVTYRPPWPWRVRQKQDFLYATVLQQALCLAAPAPGNVTCVGDPLTYFHSMCAPFVLCSVLFCVDEWTVFDFCTTARQRTS